MPNANGTIPYSMIRIAAKRVSAIKAAVGEESSPIDENIMSKKMPVIKPQLKMASPAAFGITNDESCMPKEPVFKPQLSAASPASLGMINDESYIQKMPVVKPQLKAASPAPFESINPVPIRV